MNIVQDFIPVGRKNRPGYSMKPEFITVHDVGNPNKGADAKAHASYLKGDTAANRPASWHYTVDENGAYQHLPIIESAWHAGDGATGTGNRKTIGIEICDNVDGNRTKAEENAAKLIAKLMLETGLMIDKVVQHNRWSGKNCPSSFRGAGTWSMFTALIIKEFQALTPLKEEKVSNGKFYDVPETHWAAAAILESAEKKLLAGFPDGSFKPDEPITRAQLAVVLMRLK